MEKVECVVIGAGIIGLSIARLLSIRGYEVLVLEAEEGIGRGTSSRNSEVIHAGIYYPNNSLKAKFCVNGKEMLYRHCYDYKINHKKCGKIIVASSESQLTELIEIKNNAERNGVSDLKVLSHDDLIRLEPQLNGSNGLYSPSTGIVDTHSLMLSFQVDAQDHGAMFAFNSKVTGGKIDKNNVILDVGEENPIKILSDFVINSAGLYSQQIISSILGFPEKFIPKIFYAKGNYFSITGGVPFNHLIYPLPNKAGLGIHLTIDLAGQARFGPDVEWIESIDYNVDNSRNECFYAAIREYWPDLPNDSLFPSYSGIRPKLCGRNSHWSDFLIQGQKIHGVKGIINLFGIESPGITASMAIAEEVFDLLQ